MPNMINKDLGAATAYAYAVNGGYEGSEADFTQLMADLGITLDEFQNFSVTITTLPAGSSATASYSDGVLSLGIPKGDKGDKGNTGDTGAAAGFGTVSATVDANVGTPEVTVAASGSNTSKNFAFTFKNLKGVKGDTGNGIESVALTSTSGAVKTYTITFTDGDTTTFDVTDGEVSEAELQATLESYAKVDGYYSDLTAGSAEQLLSTITIEDEVPYQFRTSGGGIDIGNREDDTLVGGSVAWNQLTPANKKSFTSTTTDTRALTFLLRLNETPYTTQFSAGIGVDRGVFGTVFSATASGGVDFRHNGSARNITIWQTGEPLLVMGHKYFLSVNVINNDTSTAGGLVTDDLMLLDLTQMFGSTIADYIYSLETATAGAGVAWFKKLFNKPYYAYNAGELKHVSGVSAHVMRDANNNIVGSYPLDSSLTLRGIPKLSNGKLYYDGDTYEADGTVTRKYASISPTSCINGYARGNGDFIGKLATNGFATNNDAPPKMVCNVGLLVNGANQQYQGELSSISINANNGDVIVCIAGITTKADLDAWLVANSFSLVYELATQTTETAEPYTNPQVVDEYGTEEYVSTSIVPVGHITKYMPNLVAKLETAPNSPSGDGDYIVRQTSGVNEYVALGNTATIQNIIARLEALEGANNG